MFPRIVSPLARITCETPNFWDCCLLSNELSSALITLRQSLSIESFQIQMGDLTLLPDGTVFLCNGAKVGEWLPRHQHAPDASSL